MTFSYPSAFYLLALLIPLVLIMIVNHRKKREWLEMFMSGKAFRSLGSRSGREVPFMKAALITAALIFFIFSLAGPKWGEKLENLNISGIEMIFLLDTSFSMNAEDVRPSRLVVAKDLIGTILDELESDYAGLIVFSGQAHVQCPLTLDYEALKLLTDAASISPPEEQGTDFYEALNLALRTARLSSNNNKIIFLITDGEDQEDRWKEVLQEIKEEKMIIFPIGVGVPEGAPIPVSDKDGNMTGWKKDNRGNIVKSLLNEPLLKQIAEETGGQYNRISDTAGIDMMMRNIKNFERSVLGKKIRQVKIDRFHYPLLIGIILLLIELILVETKIEWKKRP